MWPPVPGEVRCACSWLPFDELAASDAAMLLGEEFQKVSEAIEAVAHREGAQVLAAEAALGIETRTVADDHILLKRVHLDRRGRGANRVRANLPAGLRPHRGIMHQDIARS